ncbi:MAG: YdbL family protein [Opitutales bacterium]
MTHLRFSLFLALLFSTSLSALAASLGQVQAAMKERLPAIQALWAEGKIGENNQGFVEARADLSAKEQALLRAENADRKAVYQAIASSTQSTPKQVGVQRAAQISQRAAKGLWLQDAAGKWFQK